MFTADCKSKSYRDDEPNFRCPGCETNTGTGRYCDDCREAELGGSD
jgi:hypothetical protein